MHLSAPWTAEWSLIRPSKALLAAHNYTGFAVHGMPRLVLAAASDRSGLRRPGLARIVPLPLNPQPLISQAPAKEGRA
jgi:hypothetical protein